ncbi:hypothetical protein [Parashewanella tropica]|uniref:hypothetical protein n=1 Tax=Parashewanella tropica TaxID=2547970 RepID=UPI001059D8D5|nr:hypothetical protein [Parashewanella tropica]
MSPIDPALGSSTVTSLSPSEKTEPQLDLNKIKEILGANSASKFSEINKEITKLQQMLSTSSNSSIDAISNKTVSIIEDIDHAFKMSDQGSSVEKSALVQELHTHYSDVLNKTLQIAKQMHDLEYELKLQNEILKEAYKDRANL